MTLKASSFIAQPNFSRHILRKAARASLGFVKERETIMSNIQVDIDTSEYVGELPAGDYSANVVDAKMMTSKSGNPYIKWQFTVFGHNEAKFNGQSVWTNTMTQGKGVFGLVKLYEAATGGKKLEGGKLDTGAILGKQVMITVVPGKDQDGNPSGFSEVKGFRPYSAS